MATRFIKAGSVVLDSTGGGTVTLSPDGGDWKITLTSTLTSTATLQPQVSLYHNGISDLNFLEGSYSGSKDASDTTHVIAQGEQFIAVWSGGDPGATATLRVRGWQGRPGEFEGA